MARYKDIDTIIEQMNGSTAETWGKGLGRSWWSHSVMLKDNIVQLMKDAPEADVVEVRHGRWIKHKPDSEYIKGLHQLGIAKGMGENSIYWTCSECEHWGVLHYKYCPNCGARMDGDTE